MRDPIRRGIQLITVLRDDYRRRTFTLAVPGFTLNCLYSGFNLALGISSRNAWYISLGVYYLLLSLMRFWLLRHEFVDGTSTGPASTLREWRIVRRCGTLIMLMSIALFGMVVLMIARGYGKHYSEYVTMAMATYVFIKIGSSIASMVKASKFRSPRLSCIRNIGFVDALVSMLALQTAMFAAFGRNETAKQLIMNALTGAGVCIATIIIGLLMTLHAGRNIRLLSDATNVSRITAATYE